MAATDTTAKKGQNGDISQQIAKGAQEAGEALVKEFAKDIAAPEPAGDPEVMVAFALGWQVSELYKPGSWRRPGAHPEADLPGLGRLGGKERAELGLKQVEVGLGKLEQAIKKAGLDVPSVAAAEAALPASLPDAPYESAVFELHVALLTTLTATHFKLGKAYGLGRALADTTRVPKDLAGLKKELEEHRIANLLNWLSDLTTLVPPHAGHVVHDSLKAWSVWAADAALDEDGAKRAVGLLRRQGERWRSLLSGEKKATDALSVGDYVHAGEVALSHSANLAGSFLRRFKRVLGIALVVFVAGIALVIWDPTHGSVAAGIAAIVSSLGVTWKGVGASLGNSAAKMERPVWEGALDTQLARSLALIPGTGPAAGYVLPRPPEAGTP